MVSQLATGPGPGSMPLSGRSYWQRHGGAPVSSEATALSSDVPQRADYVIVGGGFAGLSTAIHLARAEPGARIVLLEARFLGFGASGRNAGLLAPLPAPIWLVTAAQNTEHAWALRHLNECVRRLARSLSAEAPESGVTPATLRIESHSRIMSAGLGRIARILTFADLPHASGRSSEGHLFIDLETSTIDPYRAVRALGESARRQGVAICEGARVNAIEQTADGVDLGLEGGGTLHARSAVVCTNAYTASLSLPEQPRAKPVFNFMVATEEAGAGRMGSGSEAGCFVVELNGSYVYYRHHAGRVVYGGIERLKAHGADDFAVPPDVLTRLERLMARSFPGGGLVPAEVWAGVYHQTATDLPVIRRIGARGAIVLNVGYGGTGVAMSQICGRLAAALARGVEPVDADDRRLLAAIGGTRLPVGGAARFLLAVTKDLLLGHRQDAR